MTGCYSRNFRTGGSKNSTVQLIHDSLNLARGTAYNVDVGSIIWCENLALAKAVSLVWNANATLANNFNPQKMYAFISRWENILGILPNQNMSLIQRQQIIAARFLIFSKPPTAQNVSDLLKLIIPDIFIGIEYNDPLRNQGNFPGGLTVPGGVTLPNGPFMSYLNQIKIRIWQPRDHNNNLLMTNSNFQQRQTSFFNFLNNYLPSYVGWKNYRYVTQGPGKINMVFGSNVVEGVGTTFTTTFSIGSTFETVDNNNIVRTYIISNIIDDTHLEVINSLTYNNTLGYYRILNGFILDTQNLDLQYFNS